MAVFTPSTPPAPTPFTTTTLTSGTYLLPILDLTDFDEPGMTFDQIDVSFDGYTPFGAAPVATPAPMTAVSSSPTSWTVA